MNLHRTGEKPQWETVEPEDRNIFQKVAAKTGGIVTPANVISLVGAGLVASGLRDISKGRMTRGVVKIGVGRVADLGDGLTAEATGTKSPLGEGVDVVIDATETAVAPPILVGAGVLPKSAAGIIAVENTANAVFSVIARRRGVELHPSAAGKMTRFGQWTTIGFHGLAEVARENDAPGLERSFEAAALISTVAMAGLGAKAFAGYAGDVLSPATQAQAS